MHDNEATAAEIITDAAARAVGGCLRFNVAAYGKAWTEEDEDTRFLVHEVAKEVLTALDGAGHCIVSRTAATALDPVEIRDALDSVLTSAVAIPEDVEQRVATLLERMRKVVAA